MAATIMATMRLILTPAQSAALPPDSAASKRGGDRENAVEEAKLDSGALGSTAPDRSTSPEEILKGEERKKTEEAVKREEDEKREESEKEEGIVAEGEGETPEGLDEAGVR
jgi:hypothetical protein